MDAGVQIILSGVLTFGVPLVLAARELWVLDRGIGGAGDRDDMPAPVPLAPTPGELPAPRPLPACLIPRLDSPAPSRRTRELEPV